MAEEGYAIGKKETISTFYNGYVCGDYQEIFEWDIYDDLPLSGGTTYYKGIANQQGEIIDGPYKRYNLSDEWMIHEKGGAISAGWVLGFCGLCEDITWHDRLDSE